MNQLATEFRAVIGGRTQEEVAATLGLDQATVSRILKGEHRIGHKAARAIVREFPSLRCVVTDAFLSTLQLGNGHTTPTDHPVGGGGRECTRRVGASRSVSG